MRVCCLGFLAAALSLGTAAAFASGTAQADGLDFQFSIDGYDLLPTTDNSATATSGTGDFAIAWGEGAHASATDGTGDFSYAQGNYADAFSGNGNYDSAIDIGNNTSDYTHFVIAGVGNDDFAYVNADNSLAISGGDFLDPEITGNNDTAEILDPFGVGNDTMNVGVLGSEPGNNDFGATLFDPNVLNQGATGGDYLYDIISMLGQESNAAAATSASWLTDLLGLL